MRRQAEERAGVGTVDAAETASTALVPSGLLRVGCLLLQRDDDAAALTHARVAAGLCRQVVGLFVKDDGATDDRLVSVADRDRIKLDFQAALAVFGDGHVAEVAGVVAGLFRPAVFGLAGVEVIASRLGRGIAAVALFVDVQAVLAGCGAADLDDRLDLAADLFERRGAGHGAAAFRFNGGSGDGDGSTNGTRAGRRAASQSRTDNQQRKRSQQRVHQGSPVSKRAGRGPMSGPWQCPACRG